jgi:hypothetical protein
LIVSLIPIGSCNYAEEEPIYVEDLGTVYHFHNYFDDFYVDKGGLQISNNLTEPWAHIKVGLSFSFREKLYNFWTDKLPLTWIAYNGTDYVELNGTVSLISGKYGVLNFLLCYHLDWNSSYIRITPILSANLKYAVSNVVLHYRMENISISGSVENDFCAFLFNNETYTYFLPAYFQQSIINVSESLNHLFIYDNVTWKFTDYVWDWNYTLNNIEIPVNASLVGDGTNIQVDFNYGGFPLEFTFLHSFWWHDPTETRYFRSDTQTVNGLTARKLLTTQSGVSGSIDISNYNAYIGIRVWKRSSGGVETEITDGTPRARAVIPSSSGIVSGVWSCPQTSLASTDAIVVRVYATADSITWVLLDTWVTEQLGATQLDASTWGVYYYIYVNTARGIWKFYFDTATYNSRITNFSWSVVSKTWHDVAVWSFQLLTRKWNIIGTYALTLQTRTWQNITSWTFNLITQTWHDIIIWIFTIETTIAKAFPFIILIGGIFTVAIAFFVIFKR